MIVNNFILGGTIKKIQVSEPKDPKRQASAVLLVQYGPMRDSTGGPVEFVNAAMVRVPSYKFPALRASLQVGKEVQIHGHVQGVYKSLMDDGFFSAELVADRILVEGGGRGPRNAPAAEPADADDATDE